MGLILLDTNVVSYLMNSHSLASQYRPYLTGNTPAVCFQTVAELFQGAFRARWGKKRVAELERTIARYLVVPSSHEASQEWARVRYQRRHEPISAEDAWMAATALTYDCPLVTHNPKDFRGIRGLRVITEAGK